MSTNPINCYVIVAIRTFIPFPLVYEAPRSICLGQRVKVPLAIRFVHGYVVQKDVEHPGAKIKVKNIHSILDKTPIFSEFQIETARWISKMHFASLGEVLFMLGPTGWSEKSESDSLLNAEKSLLKSEEFLKTTYELTQAQRSAFNDLVRYKGISYLYGVTGSGKTYVFLELIKWMRKENYGVLYLVPEISLSYQTWNFLGKFFPDIALIHSGLTPTQRLKTWREIQSGKKNIVLGTRSAIFAPIKNLGLIILDEEHDLAYKSGSSPRYHTRQIAMYLSNRLGIKLVMGSATPSLESYHAMEEGLIQKVCLSERMSKTDIPEIKVINMSGNNSLFSSVLVRVVLDTVEKNKQVILFLNRRGFSSFYFCQSCGFEIKCDHCSIRLTYHKKIDKLLCHYCGYKQDNLDHCPECGFSKMGGKVFGLEKAEEEVRRIFVNCRIARLDGDIARNKTNLCSILDDFANRKIDILLATQIIAKGFNFPHLHLVGILSADIGLGIPDFRAQERIFSLLTQISGRVGRYNDRGIIIIQTYNPFNSAILRITDRNIQHFYEEELQTRKDLEFPPYTRLLRLIFRSTDKKKAEHAAYSISKMLEKSQSQLQSSRIEILGPSEAPIFKIGGKYRWQILLRGTCQSKVRACLFGKLASLRAFSGVYCEIDSDPLNLL